MSKITSQDCIDFIEKSNQDGLATNLKWKRLSKKNDENKNPIREFKSNNGDIVVIKEDKQSGELEIINVILGLNNQNTVNNVNVKNLKKKVDLDLILSERDLIDEMIENKSYIIEQSNKKFAKLRQNYARNRGARDNDLLYEDRFNEYNIINSVLPNLLHLQANYGYGCSSEMNEEWEKMTKAYGVMFDLENFELTKKEFNYNGKKYSVLVGYAGGDWEFPVSIGVYWDKNKKMPIFYVPHDKFNEFDRKYKTAFGSEMNSGLVTYNFNDNDNLMSNVNGVTIAESMFEKDYDDLEFDHDEREILTLKSLKKHLIEKAENFDPKEVEDELSKEQKMLSEKTPFDFMVKNLTFNSFVSMAGKEMILLRNEKLIGKISGSKEKDRQMIIDESYKELNKINERIIAGDTKDIWNGLLKPLIAIQANISEKGMYEGLIDEYGVAFGLTNLNLKTFKIDLKNEEFVEVMFGTIGCENSVPINILMYLDEKTFMPKFFISAINNDYNQDLKIAYGAEKLFGKKSLLSESEIKEMIEKANNVFDVENNPVFEKEVLDKLRKVLDDLLSKMNPDLILEMKDNKNNKGIHKPK